MQLRSIGKGGLTLAVMALAMAGTACGLSLLFSARNSAMAETLLARLRKGLLRVAPNSQFTYSLFYVLSFLCELV